MKTHIIIFLICWIAFEPLHEALFAVAILYAFIWLCVHLRQREEPETVNWNGPNNWNQ
ncbi:MAG TPA: hypothetical protein PKY12_15460 [Catalimonadaceae bacterium]|nr:hypothetical protein [Catalimonadaceae bacterium]